jgi:8-oxo-dGTP pyrophosphatase MutT (NUDIX family)
MSLKKFYVGVKVIIKDKRGYLILKHVNEYTDMPGGRVDDNETLDQTIRREVAEELPGTVVLSVNGLRGAYRILRDVDKDTGLILLYYLAEAKLPKKIKLSSEHKSYMWINEEKELPKDLNPELDRILRKLLT